MLLQTSQPDSPPLVMGIALHPSIVGQPYRMAHLRRALQQVVAAQDAERLWLTTPGATAIYAAQVWTSCPAANGKDPRKLDDVPASDNLSNSTLKAVTLHNKQGRVSNQLFSDQDHPDMQRADSRVSSTRQRQILQLH
jgi:hypothetical protein